MDIDTAAAKAAAHSGLSDALEYGTVTALRVNGVCRLTARHDGDTYILHISPATGAVTCAGYVVSSTTRDLAYDALAAARTR